MAESVGGTGRGGDGGDKGTRGQGREFVRELLKIFCSPFFTRECLSQLLRSLVTPYTRFQGFCSPCSPCSPCFPCSPCSNPPESKKHTLESVGCRGVEFLPLPNTRTSFLSNWHSSGYLNNRNLDPFSIETATSPRW